MSYRHDCEASKGPGHPRGKFDLGHHFEQMDSIARVETGEKLVYMPFARWIKHGPEQLGMDAKEAKDKWLRKKKTLPPKMHKKTSKGVLLLPMPYEIYIIGANASEHRKGMRLEGPEAQEAHG